jgi:hypothetical protein
MERQGISKATLAEKRTSRAQVDRILKAKGKHHDRYPATRRRTRRSRAAAGAGLKEGQGMPLTKSFNDLVPRVAQIDGYNRFSFTRASAVVNCQSALACFLFR